MPCNSDSGYYKTLVGRSSGDWRGLKNNKTNIMCALKPVEEGGNKALCNAFADKLLWKVESFDLLLPDHIDDLKLNRIYRCTITITEFYRVIVRSINISSFHYASNINKNSLSYVSGHEIYGELPEILLLSQCDCFDFCKEPFNHLFITHKKQILTFIKRITKQLTCDMVVLIDTFPDSKECAAFLTEELAISDISTNVSVKVIEECRGLEFKALLTINNDSNKGARTHGDSSVIDAWTRATSSLFIIHMECKNSKLTSGLKVALKSQLARPALEQEIIVYKFWKRLFIFLQHPFFTPFHLPILLFVLINNASIIFSKNR